MPDLPTIAEALHQANTFLRERDVSEAQLTAQSLLAAALHRDRTYLIINFKQMLTSEEHERFLDLLDRRARGEPLQYILGTQEFFGLEFEVTNDVLIPRPESELIVEEVIRLSSSLESPTIIDIGTGSGCIAVAICREVPQARVIATDVSERALAVAARNASRHLEPGRVSFVAADLLGAFADQCLADFIVSNPPYIAVDELATLQREVRDWEPHIALTDFGDGMSFFRKLLTDAPARLKPRGHLLCEMGYTQSESIAALVDQRSWKELRFLADLQGIPRVLCVERR